MLRFETCFQEPEQRPFLAVFRRDSATLIVKAGDVPPLPNPGANPGHAYGRVLRHTRTDALADEYAARGMTFSVPLKDTDEGLRGFEVADPDGYVIFFGCPKDVASSGPDQWAHNPRNAA